MTGKTVAFLAITLAANPAASVGQEIWQADVRIQSLDVTAGKGSISVRVFVTSDNDDDARGVRLDLLLPVGAGVIRMAPGCRPSTSPVANLVGRVTCDLGAIPVRGLREITIAATAPPTGNGRKVAAFVVSDTPDPEPGNNYAERIVP